MVIGLLQLLPLSKQKSPTLWNSGYRGLIRRLSEEDLKQFRNEHLKWVDDVADESGIWLEAEVLLSTATGQ